METKDIMTVSTSHGELHYYRDWDMYDGGIVMMDARTIRKYKELLNMSPDGDECGVFFAFSNEQFNKGYKRLIELGHIKEGDKICQDSVTGMYGTGRGITRFHEFYANRDKEIKNTCDPQEVYFYEWNNYETMYSWDGDTEAMRTVIHLFGIDAARGIYRVSGTVELDNLS